MSYTAITGQLNLHKYYGTIDTIYDDTQANYTSLTAQIATATTNVQNNLNTSITNLGNFAITTRGYTTANEGKINAYEADISANYSAIGVLGNYVNATRDLVGQPHMFMHTYGTNYTWANPGDTLTNQDYTITNSNQTVDITTTSDRIVLFSKTSTAKRRQMRGDFNHCIKIKCNEMLRDGTNGGGAARHWLMGVGIFDDIATTMLDSTNSAVFTPFRTHITNYKCRGMIANLGDNNTQLVRNYTLDYDMTSTTTMFEMLFDRTHEENPTEITGKLPKVDENYEFFIRWRGQDAERKDAGGTWRWYIPVDFKVHAVDPADEKTGWDYDTWFPYDCAATLAEDTSPKDYFVRFFVEDCSDGNAVSTTSEAKFTIIPSWEGVAP